MHMSEQLPLFPKTVKVAFRNEGLTFLRILKTDEGKAVEIGYFDLTPLHILHMCKPPIYTFVVPPIYSGIMIQFLILLPSKFQFL